MAFVLPLIGESIITGIEASAAGGVIHEIAHQFAPTVKTAIADETGKALSNISKNNPDGIVNKTLERTNYYNNTHHHKRKNKRRIS